MDQITARAHMQFSIFKELYMHSKYADYRIKSKSKSEEEASVTNSLSTQSRLFINLIS
jgi:hypothetical protein